VLVNVGRRRRLRTSIPDIALDDAANDQSRHAAGEGNRMPRPGTALAGRGSEIAEERPWPNGS
jgi:hypothetical protein